MKNRTKTLLHHRKQIIEEWLGGSNDYAVTEAIHFSGVVRPYTDDPDEQDRLLELEQETSKLAEKAISSRNVESPHSHEPAFTRGWGVLYERRTLRNRWYVSSCSRVGSPTSGERL